jgi:hypothetical protein
MKHSSLLSLALKEQKQISTELSLSGKGEHFSGGLFSRRGGFIFLL